MRLRNKKSAVMEVKENEGAPGTFTGYASVFNNVDSMGDIVAPGAFTKSLGNYGPNGAGIPCYWEHRTDDPNFCIGWTKSAVQDDHGLRVEVQLDLENPIAQQAYKLLKNGVTRQMSFYYEVKDYGVQDDNFILKELEIFEVSVTQVGANQETEIVSVKSFPQELKAFDGTLQQTSAKLDQVSSLLAEVAAALLPDKPTPSRDEEQEQAKPEEGESPNGEEPNPAKSRTLELASDVAKLFNLNIPKEEN